MYYDRKDPENRGLSVCLSVCVCVCKQPTALNPCLNKSSERQTSGQNGDDCTNDFSCLNDQHGIPLFENSGHRSRFVTIFNALSSLQRFRVHHCFLATSGTAFNSG